MSCNNSDCYLSNLIILKINKLINYCFGALHFRKKSTK